MKSFLYGGLLVLLTLIPGPNVTAAADTTHTIYRIFLGLVEQDSELNKFHSLQSLGFITPYSNVSRSGDRIAPGLRVYLGEYLDEATAAHMLLQVWSAGYSDAYIEKDELTLRYGIGSEMIYTIQIGAFRRLPMQRFAGIRSEFPYGIFVSYEDGLFKVFAGLYAGHELAELKRTTLPWLHEQGYPQAYVRQFREPYVWVE